MIDASAGFMKDGAKNRLRAMDIHKIVDVFNRRLEIPGYARMVGFDEIEQRNEFNLNIPRYIDSHRDEDLQDIEGHLRGGIPVADVDALAPYWSVCPDLRQTLFEDNRPGYLDLAVEKSAIKPAIYGHPQFAAFIACMNTVFSQWREPMTARLKALTPGLHPKQLIVEISEDLLAQYGGKPLIDKYSVYQHLLDYWLQTMQDDCYFLDDDGWKAETYRIIDKNKKDKGWACDLVPKNLIVNRYFAAERDAIAKLETEMETIASQIEELEEEHGGDESAFSGLDKINKATVTAQLREIKNDPESQDEATILSKWLDLSNQQFDLKRALKSAEDDLDNKAYHKYPTLSEDEIKTLVVDEKWMAALDSAIHGQVERISQALTQRVKQLAERYERPLPKLNARVAELEQLVSGHLKIMGFAWN
jgi:type I restriction enzyme M protein